MRLPRPALAGAGALLAIVPLNLGALIGVRLHTAVPFLAS